MQPSVGFSKTHLKPTSAGLVCVSLIQKTWQNSKLCSGLKVKDGVVVRVFRILIFRLSAHQLSHTQLTLCSLPSRVFLSSASVSRQFLLLRCNNQLPSLNRTFSVRSPTSSPATLTSLHLQPSLIPPLLSIHLTVLSRLALRQSCFT
jgi:hypothetical protein